MGHTTPSRTSPADVAGRIDAYFTALQAAFEAAGDRGDRTDVGLRLAGRPLRLGLAGGPTAAAVLPALAHAARGADRSADRAVDHEVLVWDGASTHTPLPEAPWHWPPPDAQVRTVLPAGGEGYRIPGSRRSGSFAMLSIAARRTIVWLADAAATPRADRAAPLMQVWRWWARSNGLRIMHAGCVGTADAAAILVGPGGSGKSSTSVLAALAGLRFVSDDYCLLDAAAEPVAHALFGTAKLDGTHMARFPNLPADAVIDPANADEKAIILMEKAAPGRMAASLPVRAVLAVRVTGATRPRLVPTRAAEALRAVAPSTLMQLYSDDRSGCGDLAALVRRLPCWRLELGGPLVAVSDLLLRHLASL